MSLVDFLKQRCSPGLWFLWLPCSILWLECVLRVYAFHSLLGRGLLYVVLFSLSLGLILTFLCSLFRPKARRCLTAVLVGLLALWHMVQTVYYTVFSTFLTLYSVGAGIGSIFQYWREILTAISNAFPTLLLEVIPLILVLLLGRFTFPADVSRRALRCRLVGGGVVLYAAAVVAVMLSTRGLMSPRYLYRETFLPDLSVSTFGLMTTLRLDAQQLVFGQAETAPAVTPTPTPTPAPTPAPDATQQPAVMPTPSPEPELPKENVLPLDFAALAANEEDPGIRALHTYFGSRTPTMRNEYTGLFEGKNLIYITAEAFSPFAVDAELTPTLYKLANTGFVFENFYTPLWWASTTDGEYVNCQSLVPKSGTWAMERSATNTLPFTLGNQLRRLGYSTYAYHNHNAQYYDRSLSHPNMGYEFQALDSGLEVTRYWPESDREMMELSIPDYLDKAPFHTYYMTVSGHLYYTFDYNDMSARHEQAVAHLKLSEISRAYIACNIELDKALEYLLAQLEAAGILEDTVICLAADHYPYGLDKALINELAGHKVDRDFELYESTLILWSGDMEQPVIVEKPCCNMDILPTLSNLFGLEYDSRLMMGKDILSDSEGLVVFSNHSFITEYGRYNARTDEFIPLDQATVPENHAPDVMAQVNDMFQYSAAVLDHDYYSTLPLFTPSAEN